MKSKGIYPGSFDPLTNGHIDVIKRGLTFLDRVTVAIAAHSQKPSFFTPEERKGIIEEVFAGCERVEVEIFDGLLVSYMHEKKTNVVIRGLRAVSDFEYEFQLATANRTLDKNIETIFLMPAQEFFFISASLVKEIAMLEGDISAFVPEVVARVLREKINC